MDGVDGREAVSRGEKRAGPAKATQPPSIKDSLHILEFLLERESPKIYWFCFLDAPGISCPNRTHLFSLSPCLSAEPALSLPKGGAKVLSLLAAPNDKIRCLRRHPCCVDPFLFC